MIDTVLLILSTNKMMVIIDKNNKILKEKLCRNVNIVPTTYLLVKMFGNLCIYMLSIIYGTRL